MTNPKYRITYDFDAKNEPPKVIIRSDGRCICEVDEVPLCQLGGFLAEDGEWHGQWSWEEEDWVPGPIAAQLLAVMNMYM